MKERKNGIKTKQVILESARRLFYDKGYRETTYEDICQAAGVNSGTLYYHYKTKAAIASLIFVDFFAQSRSRIQEILKSEYSRQIFSAVEIRSYLRLIFSDRNFLRFFYDIYCERVPNRLALEDIQTFYQRLADEFKIDLNGIDLKTIGVVASGFQCEFIINYFEGYLTAPIEMLTEYYLTMRFRFVQLSERKIKYLLSISREAADRLDIALTTDFVPVYKMKG